MKSIFEQLGGTYHEENGYPMLLIAVEIAGIIIIIWHEIVENLSFIGYDKGIN